MGDLTRDVGCMQSRDEDKCHDLYGSTAQVVGSRGVNIK